MITKIEIQNFQVHRHLVIELNPNVTVLIGQTNAGKTAVLRAIEWVVFNRPAGDDFRTYGSTNTQVTLHTESGYITRYKNASDNGYILGDGQNEITFRAFGQKVPEEVQNFLNMKAINFQEQEVSTFLIDDVSGEAARKLNEVANLELIDDARKKINELYREHNKELKRQRSKLKELQTQLREYDWIEGCEKMMYEALSLIGAERTLTEDIKEVKTVLEQLEKLEQEEEQLIRNIDAQKGSIDELTSLVQKDAEIQRLNQDIKEVEDILDRIKQLEQKEKDLENFIKIGKEKYNKLMPDICPLCEQSVKKMI